MTALRSAPSRSPGAPPAAPPGAATVGQTLRAAAARLATAGIPTARQDAEALLAHVLGTTRLHLYTDGRAGMPETAAAAFERVVARRVHHEPVQYLLGAAEFCGLVFEVDPGVFIPRPETEALVARALALGPAGAASVLDVCTGSGALACALATRRPDWTVKALERAAPAIACAGANVRRLGLEGRVQVLPGDLFGALGAGGPADVADLIVANPPYLAASTWSALPAEVREWEPRDALDGGADGLDVVQRLLGEAPTWLRPGGALLVEIGEEQGPAVRALAGTDGRYAETHVHQDFRGRERVLEARRR